LPVRELGKGANQRCKHQRVGRGCAVYRRPDMPMSCALWSCRWLGNADTADLSRPDRAHYVIDVMPDFIVARDDRTGETRHIEVVQVWVDPRYRDAHRDPALRAYLARRAEEGVAALIRYSATDAFTLFAPRFFDDGLWHEVHGSVREATHSTVELLQGLAQCQR
jgi:hypothetical protein